MREMWLKTYNGDFASKMHFDVAIFDGVRTVFANQLKEIFAVRLASFALMALTFDTHGDQPLKRTGY
jgi:hypothetical protein